MRIKAPRSYRTPRRYRKLVKVEVPTAADVAEKWAKETPGRQPYYEKNTIGQGAKMEKNAIAAESTFKLAVQASDIGKRFSGGLKGSSGKFDRKVKDVGVGRFGPGVEAAKPDMESGIAPALAVIAATEIPARKPRGDDSNYKRSKDLGDAGHKARLARMAAGTSA
jgi:hypothetical protein